MTQTSSRDSDVAAFRGRDVVVNHPVKVDYAALDAKIAEFFKTAIPPVPNQETLEIYAFMDAAERSKDSGGKPASLQ